MATDRRTEFDKWLRKILGSNNVYFQPPESKKLEFPCIVYNISSHDVDYADDKIYQLRHKYVVRYVAYPKDFDGPMKENLARELNVPIQQIYAQDGLYHCVFTKIY